MVLTKIWMLNFVADWDESKNFCIFIWRTPIQAIMRVEITEADGMLTLILKFDFVRNNTILTLKISLSYHKTTAQENSSS